MKVKVGDKVYTSKNQPIMVILMPGDKRNIANMLPEATRYAEFDDSYDMSDQEKQDWMENISEAE